MRQVSRDELKEILERHRKWHFGEEGGECADLSDADLSDANLRGANLSGAYLSDADLSDADLRGANLRGANLSDANLSDADLSDADLRGANLSGAYLSDAYLSDANLSDADLSDADLRGAVGNFAHMKSIFLDTYPITYTAEVMQIGCQRHQIADWWDFSEESIRDMDGDRAVEWWTKYKAFIQQAIALSPAEPTGAEGKEAEKAA